ncbi:hypothetical protein BH20ACI2_BH20ACI2_04320 [soil metagenome]
MKRFNLLIAVIVVACFVSACGSSNAKRAQPSPTPERGSDAKPGVNSNAVTITNTNANIKVANVPSIPEAGEPPLVNGSVERRRGRSRERERIEEDPSATPPPLTFQNAPENSEFAVYMDKGGIVVETRIFKGHPQLKTVVMKWIDPQTRALKVTLQNGKIVERQAVRIANLRTVSTTELLNIIGIEADANQAVQPPTAPKR